VLVAIAAAVAALLAVAADLLGPRVARRWRARADRTRPGGAPVLQDPGRERRAEQRARALLRSCVNPEDWELYRDLGFLRVWSSSPNAEGEERCAYLLYPHRPIVAYLPSTRRLIGEYCVSFEDPDRTYGTGRLPDSDDVLAKWMALTGDEKGLISVANMHLPDRQVDRTQVERDLVRLAQWDQDRGRRGRRASQAAHQPSLIPSRAS
jgi:hypothetical protein